MKVLIVVAILLMVVTLICLLNTKENFDSERLFTVEEGRNHHRQRHGRPSGPQPYGYPAFNPGWWDLVSAGDLNLWAGTCKDGCASMPDGGWGCELPGYGPNDCMFRSDCTWC